ncbi:MAG: ATP-grasp fold amidoligase family protein [Pseudomonadota bacterium]
MKSADYKVTYWNVLADFKNGRFSKAVSAILAFFGLYRLEEFFHSNLAHKRAYGRWPNLIRPQRFRDHLLRIKLSPDGHAALRMRITDKELVKEYIRDKVGDGYTARTYAVLHNDSEIRGYTFPDDCAIKATHDSGSIIIRRSGNPIELKRIENWLKRDYYWLLREPNYRHLKPKVIVEELLSGKSDDLVDYKIFCFHGVPAFIQVDATRFTHHARAMYSPGWKKLNFRINHFEWLESSHPAPPGLAEMLSIARILSKDFSFLRVDFFQLDNQIIVGELTNFPAGTMNQFHPDQADFLAGSLFRNPHADVESLFGLAPSEYAHPADPLKHFDIPNTRHD